MLNLAWCFCATIYSRANNKTNFLNIQNVEAEKEIILKCQKTPDHFDYNHTFSILSYDTPPGKFPSVLMTFEYPIFKEKFISIFARSCDLGDRFVGEDITIKPFCKDSGIVFGLRIIFPWTYEILNECLNGEMVIGLVSESGIIFNSYINKSDKQVTERILESICLERDENKLCAIYYDFKNDLIDNLMEVVHVVGIFGGRNHNEIDRLNLLISGNEFEGSKLTLSKDALPNNLNVFELLIIATDITGSYNHVSIKFENKLENLKILK